MKKRSYRATPVKQVDWGVLRAGHGRMAVGAGFDVGKEAVLTTIRWEDGRFERPWLTKNPQEIGVLVGLLKWIAQQRPYVMWLGRLEGLLARYWPEATRWLKLRSGTLLRALERYGGPANLCSDGAAAGQLGRWGGPYLKVATIRGLLDSARQSLGVRQSEIDVRRVREYVGQALAARGQIARSKRRLEKLARGNAVIQRQAKGVGVATACVLWVHLGDPTSYYCAEAYRKAMGLNLAERSSGLYQGKLKISKRGYGQVRRWLYLASLRLIRQSPVRRWYQRKKAKDGERAKGAVTGVMRKLALALYQVGACGAVFESRRLFPGRRQVRRRELSGNRA